MEKLINKNGMEIQNSAKAVFEELVRGTGCVMAEKLSIFMMNESITEKFIVVCRAPGSQGREELVRFASGRFKDAWELFVKWENSE
ncbi:MAG: hypothetical protein ACE5E9_10405 [Nitrospinaceae bacterium]